MGYTLVLQFQGAHGWTWGIDDKHGKRVEDSPCSYSVFETCVEAGRKVMFAYIMQNLATN